MFKNFIKSGGNFYKEICKDIKFINGNWTVILDKNKKIFDEVVICVGPWSKDFLSNIYPVGFAGDATRIPFKLLFRISSGTG